jgi:hypothetical protein
MLLSKHCSPFCTLATNSAPFQSAHYMPISYSHCLQIFLNLISSSFPRPFSFLFLPFGQSLFVLTFLRSYFYIVFSQQMHNSFFYVSLSMLFNDSDKLIFGFRGFARCVRRISQRRFGSRCGSHFLLVMCQCVNEQRSGELPYTRVQFDSWPVKLGSTATLETSWGNPPRTQCKIP